MSAPLVPTTAFPRPIVHGADAAIAFYRHAFGAELVERFAEPDGLVGCARSTLGDSSFALSEKIPDWGWISPCEGRLRDPFGHLWILSRQVAK